MLEVALSEELLALALLSVLAVLSLAVWFKEPFRLEELVLLLVTFDDSVSVSCEFWPRLYPLSDAPVVWDWSTELPWLTVALEPLASVVRLPS